MHHFNLLRVVQEEGILYVYIFDRNVEVKPLLIMDKFNYTVVTLDYQEVPSFFAGAKETQFPWSKCRWRTKRPGISLHQGVMNQKKNNPRKRW